MSRSLVATFILFSLMGSKLCMGQEPVKPVDPVPPGEAQGNRTPAQDGPKTPDEIKPLPLVPIPDEPPPHEGAMFDLPITIEPPDILIIEVLEALPARPITGEHLVKPDGKISLGFYGEVYVRGLTIEQAKIKIVLHLKKYLGEEELGLIELIEEMPVQEDPLRLDPLKPVPQVDPPQVKLPTTSSLQRKRKNREGRSTSIAVVAESQQPIPSRIQLQPEPQPGQEARLTEFRLVSPADTSHVFVDFIRYNSKVYYVQGDVGVPGRLPWTGVETVLDALNYAGGFVHSAEPRDIHLYRPARGGKPAKDYWIDHAAILKGDATANLQMFPNDRLVIGRNPVFKKQNENDRAAGPQNSSINTSFSQSLTERPIEAVTTTMVGRKPVMTPAQ